MSTERAPHETDAAAELLQAGPVPPATREDSLSWLRLIRSRRVGSTTFFRMLAKYGSAQASLDALPEIAARAGIDDYRLFTVDAAHDEFACARSVGARLLAFGAPHYPQPLASIQNPPPLIWALGEPALLTRPCIALVGARNASSVGLRMARHLAHGLGEAGFTIVSGMARGIDAAAHIAALTSGTAAVLAGGVDVNTNPGTAGIADDIRRHGVRISEQPMGMVPQARHFPRRNRLISGLCSAVIVVEAASRSGSLITAHCALEQGREVLVVPGHPYDSRSGGCNKLIRDGAMLIRSVDDVLAVLRDGGACAQRPPPSAPRDRAATGTMQPLTGISGGPPRTGANDTRDEAGKAPNMHEQILSLLGTTPVPVDVLIRDLAISARQLGSALTELELEGKIHRTPGGLLSRVPAS